MASDAKRRETLRGTGELRLNDRTLGVHYLLRFYQDFSDDVPGIISAGGQLIDLSVMDGHEAVVSRGSLDLRLQDDRIVKVIVTSEVSRSFRYVRRGDAATWVGVGPSEWLS